MKSIALFAVAIALAVPARAEESADQTIQVSGEATVVSRPDRVEIELGVETRATLAREAATRNAADMQRVIAGLKRALGPKAAIETVTYTLQPEYEREPDAERAKLKGFVARNVVQVTLDDLSAAGRTIDLATSVGANIVPSIRFVLANQEAVRAQALRRAAADARAKAQTLATALGVTVTGVASAVEATSPGPVYETSMLRTTPIAPRGIETRATVTLTVVVEPARSKSS